MIFPYMEQNALWDEWSTRFAQQPSAPAIEMLTCPSDPPEIPTEPWCNYVGNAGQAVSCPTRSSKLTAASQSASRTATSPCLLMRPS